MKYLVLALITIGVLGCTKVCELAQSTAASVAPKIAEKWGCTNQAAIVADLKGVVEKSFVCTNQRAGVVGNLVCPVLVEFVRSQLSNKVPAAWGCNASLVGADAAAGLSGLCASAFPF